MEFQCGLTRMYESLYMHADGGSWQVLVRYSYCSWQLQLGLGPCIDGYGRTEMAATNKALFSLRKKLGLTTVAFLFLFDNYCLIIY